LKSPSFWFLFFFSVLFFFFNALPKPHT
jgi:hypothetical protein